MRLMPPPLLFGLGTHLKYLLSFVETFLPIWKTSNRSFTALPSFVRIKKKGQRPSYVLIGKERRSSLEKNAAPLHLIIFNRKEICDNDPNRDVECDSYLSVLTEEGTGEVLRFLLFTDFPPTSISPCFSLVSNVVCYQCRDWHICIIE